VTVSRLLILLTLAGLAVASCNGTTGDKLITFNAYATGVRGAGEPFTVTGCPVSPCPPDEIYTVQLTFAQMYVGAVYVNEAPAGSGGTFNTPSCVDPGTYCGQVPGGVEIDLLDTALQPFSVQGDGTADLGLSWELYLTGGDVNSDDNNSADGVPNTVDLVGTATRESDGQVFWWAATINVNQSNRGMASQDPGQPGMNPICKQRILELGGIDLQLFQGGQMVLTVDPRGWFNRPIDFSTLPPAASSQCQIDPDSLYEQAQYCIPDSSNLSGAMLGAQQGVNLYSGLFTGGSAGFTLTYSTTP
jgi:hypothetical protein